MNLKKKTQTYARINENNPSKKFTWAGTGLSPSNKEQFKSIEEKVQQFINSEEIKTQIEFNNAFLMDKILKFSANLFYFQNQNIIIFNKKESSY